MHCIVIAASSDIGAALCTKWRADEHSVLGTYRTESENTQALRRCGVQLMPCDLQDDNAVRSAGHALGTVAPWDVLVLAGGSMNPIGLFEHCDFDAWQKGLHLNYIQQLRLVHALLPLRNRSNPLGACVLFFAGSGTNGPAPCYSAYTISKICSIKTCELLDAEVDDVRFVALGPGWVKTKIHQETLDAGDNAADNYEKTLHRLENNQFISMQTVVDSCDWILSQPKHVVGGRNFSAAHDALCTAALPTALSEDKAMYKLRRAGNEWKNTK